MKIQISFVFFTAAFAYVLAGKPAEVTGDNIYEFSEYWPAKVAFCRTVEFDGSTYREGREGILIRIERTGEVVIDFGRDGIVRSSLKETDLLRRARSLRLGESVKEFPNWTMMVGRTLMEVNSGGRPQRVSPEDVREFSRFFFIYFDAGAEMVSEELSVLAEFREILENAGCLPVAISLSLRGGNPAINAVLDGANLPIVFMQSHLLEAYVNSMQHDPSRFLQLVLTDDEGKTIIRQSANETTEACLSRVLETIGPGSGRQTE